MKRWIRHTALAMVAVLAYFVCGNTVFVHAHCYDGRIVTHSHPFAPGKSHSHTSSEMTLITAINVAAVTCEATDAVTLDCRIDTPVETILSEPAGKVIECDREGIRLRGPPEMV